MEPWPLFSDPTATPSPPTSRGHRRPDPGEALARLRAGNHRVALGASSSGGTAVVPPYAVVLGCIDARVPVEAVFAQGPGAICVVRSAGHVLDRAVIGSVEFAVTDLDVSLVVVLGHDDCRAVAAAVDTVRTGRRPAGTRRYVIDQITPAIPEGPAGPHNLEQITRSHIRRTVAAIKEAGHVNDAVKARRVDVVGAIYRLSSGRVEVQDPQRAI